MIGSHQSPAERVQAETAWLALLSGAAACADLDDEEDEEADDEDEPTCEACGGTRLIRYWPSGVSQYQHPGWTAECPDCGGWS